MHVELEAAWPDRVVSSILAKRLVDLSRPIYVVMRHQNIPVLTMISTSPFYLVTQTRPRNSLSYIDPLPVSWIPLGCDHSFPEGVRRISLDARTLEIGK